jgi:DNA repair protein RadA/Sms
MAKKIKSSFFCQSCGNQSPKWLGKCPQCSEWNTFVEEIITKEKNTKGNYKSNKKSIPSLVSDINYTNEKRILTNDKELNRVLGGGIVPGSLILLGGDPGIGKSTLMLQFALSSKKEKNPLCFRRGK